MRRREFIELLFLAATGWPRAASAETSPRISRIVVLMPYGEGQTSDRTRSAFEQSLRDLSWIDGRMSGSSIASQAAILGGCAVWRKRRSSSIPT
jgi:hypothetical protein